MLKVKYFAYGSNLSIERLRNRLATNKNPILQGQKYILENYKLVFNVGFTSFANIVPSQGDIVEGILYDITPEQFKVLDGIELFYIRSYFQIDKNTIGCTYIGKEDVVTRERKPDLFYLNIIIDGAEESGLIHTYKNLVIYKLKNYKLKKSKHICKYT